MKNTIKNFGQFVNEQMEFNEPIRNRIRSVFNMIPGVGIVELYVYYGGEGEGSEDQIEYFDFDSNKYSASDQHQIEKYLKNYHNELEDAVINAGNPSGISLNKVR